ncbi:FHA domain-containing protein [Methanoculleus sp. FWC-SCC1]|uniref:FHA domain-containing protein n=1 Tax=Methanoculleus frigidifontis TaxID=2584085 RepID=A0ABT8M813_9EURY|nr:FHA domain-containing protein [Methanoculleus sp. FWC-SCC1]MDN7024074.1 FHA domain-containing protein [Methanoculleus sp. FWC-SCC1]
MHEDEAGETIILPDEVDSFRELSEYLDVLSSSTRLRILKIIERKPKDIRQISSEIRTSYENTKKHIDKLLSIGVVRKEAGLSRPTSKGIHPVWKYSLVPGGMEAIVRNLGLFSNMRLASADADLSARLAAVRGQVAEEFSGGVPAVTLLGGPDDGTVFPLEGERIAVGRGDRDAAGDLSAILLSEEYAAVTRVSKPHARFTLQSGVWHIEDCGSTGGTFVNGAALAPHHRQPLQDGDLIDLARGVHGASFVYTERGRSEREEEEP